MPVTTAVRRCDETAWARCEGRPGRCGFAWRHVQAMS